jgi:sialate O-acetylesterase
MVAPAIGYSIKGAIWYQGEANAGAARAPIYDKVFGAMITDWRRHWQQGNFPFFFVQLADYKASPADLWPTVRDAQRRTLSLANTGMAVTIDLGDPGNMGFVCPDYQRMMFAPHTSPAPKPTVNTVIPFFRRPSCSAS